MILSFRILFSIFLTGIFFGIPHFSYASTGKISPLVSLSGTERSISGSLEILVEKKTSSWSIQKEVSEEIDSEEEEKIKQDINSYIIESYKAQGTKIIKDLSTKLTKTLPDTNERQEAYRKIQDSLELRKNRMEKVKMSETKRLILEEFLNHMIDLLGKKIEELEK